MENVTGRESLGNLDRAVLEGALWIDARRVDQHLGELVRQSVEQTLNGLLDAEADKLCGAKRYERPVERLDARWLRVSSFGLRHFFVIRASPFVIFARLSLAISARRRPRRFAAPNSQISAFLR
jgi:hypothetical protein